VRDVVLSLTDADFAHETEYTQAALFAVEAALARLLESFGVRPAVVAGHSLGGLTAAYVAGVFSMPVAAKLVVARGRLMTARAGADAPVVALTRRDRLERETVLTALAELSVRGVPVDWSPVLPAEAPVVPLPTTAFQRQHYWLVPDRDGASAIREWRYQVDWE